MELQEAIICQILDINKFKFKQFMCFIKCFKNPHSLTDLYGTPETILSQVKLQSYKLP